MSIAILNIIVCLTLALVCGYFAFTVLGMFGSAMVELKKDNIDIKDDIFAELYMKMSPDTFFLIRTVLAVVFFVIGFLAVGIIVGAMFGGLGFAIPLMLLKRYKDKRVKKIELQLIEALELLGNSLKSGMTLPQATELIVKEFPAPISQEFALLMSEYKVGVDFNDALENMAKRLDSAIVYILASGVSITKRVGGDMSVIFGNIAQTIRDKATIEGKLNAVTAQGRFQGLILGMMPFMLVIVLYFIDRQHVMTLFTYRLGIWAFTAVCLMVLLAQLWIKKLLKIDI
ncbi:MAG: type II secretion system F family protein [Proteobacteria bacterium]|nr:type II secretion system F family protein [Pseudomonadota bacterium]